MTSEGPTQSERPCEPEFRAAQRARLVLRFVEADDVVQEADDGWARIDGPWVHWFSEQQGYWQSWPHDKVICIEWEKVDAPPF